MCVCAHQFNVVETANRPPPLLRPPLMPRWSFYYVITSITAAADH